jgi:muramoyltetrapeptide carboxypeptidase
MALNRQNNIYVISLSSAVQNPKTLERGVQRLAKLGFPCKVDRHALAVDTRFAGTDAQRLSALNRALKQTAPTVMASRGGYGVTRLLNQIDWRAVADSGKRFVGQSDFTAFSLALLSQTSTESYLGPTVCADFGASKLNTLTAELFGEVMRGELEILSFESPNSDAVDCRGVLWGGNLSMISALVGTPYLPKIKGGILFIEDVAEHPYRIERMLIQLAQSGVLAKQKALVLGHFTDYTLAPHDQGYDLSNVMKWVRDNVGIPVVTGLPFGHTPVKATLPIGKKVGLATELGMAYLVLDEHTHD